MPMAAGRMGLEMRLNTWAVITLAFCGLAGGARRIAELLIVVSSEWIRE
jgi:hypothetical protein